MINRQDFDNNEIVHMGVKGMKWGKKKAPPISNVTTVEQTRNGVDYVEVTQDKTPMGRITTTSTKENANKITSKKAKLTPEKKKEKSKSFLDKLFKVTTKTSSKSYIIDSKTTAISEINLAPKKKKK